MSRANEGGVKRDRLLAATSILTVVLAATWLASIPLAGQVPSADQTNYTAPRTLWGDPDLQGIWGLGSVFTPLESPDELADKEFLTDQEVAALEAEHRESRSGDGTGGRTRGERGTVEDVEGAYNQVFSHGGNMNGSSEPSERR